MEHEHTKNKQLKTNERKTIAEMKEHKQQWKINKQRNEQHKN